MNPKFVGCQVFLVSANETAGRRFPNVMALVLLLRIGYRRACLWLSECFVA